MQTRNLKSARQRSDCLFISNIILWSSIIETFQFLFCSIIIFSFSRQKRNSCNRVSIAHCSTYTWRLLVKNQNSHERRHQLLTQKRCYWWTTVAGLVVLVPVRSGSVPKPILFYCLPSKSTTANINFWNKRLTKIKTWSCDRLQCQICSRYQCRFFLVLLLLCSLHVTKLSRC